MLHRRWIEIAARSGSGLATGGGLALLLVSALALALLASCATLAPPSAAPEQPLTAAQLTARAMASAQAALASGEGEQAWQDLAAAREPTAAPEALSFLALERRAALAAGRPADAVRAEIESERFLAARSEKLAARMTLLESLRDASERGMRISPGEARDPTVRGWLALASLVAEAARAPTSAASAIEAWRRRYPGHPADAVLGAVLLGASAPPRAAKPSIALLLPLTGPAARAAATVRDGFMSAYYVGAAADRPRIRIYDTGAEGVANAIERATRDGAALIVGPLTRPAVVAAADLHVPRPPMLALNFLPDGRSAPAAFYQFALSPEQEARAVARRILAEGHRRGIALVPLGDWGTRVLTAFDGALTAAGGEVLDTVRYDPSLTDFGPAITAVLGLDESNARAKRLESLLGRRLDFEPRRRGDIDFIFEASAAASTARLLRTQIRFYFAGDIPAYATSDSFEPGPDANQDLDGLEFPDMPWMLGGGLAESVHAAAVSAWPVGGPPLDRLFAFGFDAYRLAATLRDTPAGSAITIEGLTGVLTLDASGRVHRQLEWAQLRGGQPQLLPKPAAPAAAPATPPAPTAATPAAATPAAPPAPAPPQ